MPFGCQLRVAGVYAASLTGFCCLLLLYCELAHHYLVLMQVRYSHWMAPVRPSRTPVHDV